METVVDEVVGEPEPSDDSERKKSDSPGFEEVSDGFLLDVDARIHESGSFFFSDQRLSKSVLAADSRHHVVLSVSLVVLALGDVVARRLRDEEEDKDEGTRQSSEEVNHVLPLSHEVEVNVERDVGEGVERMHEGGESRSVSGEDQLTQHDVGDLGVHARFEPEQEQVDVDESDEVALRQSEDRQQQKCGVGEVINPDHLLPSNVVRQREEGQRAQHVANEEDGPEQADLVVGSAPQIVVAHPVVEVLLVVLIDLEVPRFASVVPVALHSVVALSVRTEGFLWFEFEPSEAALDNVGEVEGDGENDSQTDLVAKFEGEYPTREWRSGRERHRECGTWEGQWSGIAWVPFRDEPRSQ